MSTVHLHPGDKREQEKKQRRCFRRTPTEHIRIEHDTTGGRKQSITDAGVTVYYPPERPGTTLWLRKELNVSMFCLRKRPKLYYYFKPGSRQGSLLCVICRAGCHMDCRRVVSVGTGLYAVCRSGSVHCLSVKVCHTTVCLGHLST